MASRRIRGAGGQSARRAARTNLVIDTAKYIERNIPNFEIMNLESIEIIEEKAEEVLENIGVKFLDNPKALKLWKEAGADVTGELVKIPKGLSKKLCSTAPGRIIQHARNPKRTVNGANVILLKEKISSPLNTLGSSDLPPDINKNPNTTNANPTAMAI